MFPIMDGKGRVVAFGGRVMDDSTPKYLNSPESAIFEKGKLLFAFDKAYKSIRQEPTGYPCRRVYGRYICS